MIFVCVNFREISHQCDRISRSSGFTKSDIMVRSFTSWTKTLSFPARISHKQAISSKENTLSSSSSSHSSDLPTYCSSQTKIRTPISITPEVRERESKTSCVQKWSHSCGHFDLYRFTSAYLPLKLKYTPLECNYESWQKLRDTYLEKKFFQRVSVKLFGIVSYTSYPLIPIFGNLTNPHLDFFGQN